MRSSDFVRNSAVICYSSPKSAGDGSDSAIIGHDGHRLVVGRREDRPYKTDIAVHVALAEDLHRSLVITVDVGCGYDGFALQKASEVCLGRLCRDFVILSLLEERIPWPGYRDRSTVKSEAIQASLFPSSTNTTRPGADW